MDMALLIEIVRDAFVAAFVLFCHQGFTNLALYSSLRQKRLLWFAGLALTSAGYSGAMLSESLPVSVTFKRAAAHVVWWIATYMVYFHARSLFSYFGHESRWTRALERLLLAISPIPVACLAYFLATGELLFFSPQGFVHPNFFTEAAVGNNFSGNALTSIYGALVGVSTIAVCVIAIRLTLSRPKRDYVLLAGVVFALIALFNDLAIGAWGFRHSISFMFLAYALEIMRLTYLAQVETGRDNLAMAGYIADERAKAIHSAKMASLGEMAAGIAHEVNNPLAVIQAKAVQAKRLLDQPHVPGGDLKRHLDVIDRTSQRISRTVNSLRMIAREGHDVPPAVSALGDIIAMTLDICHERMRSRGIRVDTSGVDGGVKLRCRDFQISQVLLNLLNNAFDAIQDQGSPWVTLSSRVSDGRVTVTVTDSGEGIPPGVAEKIMEPFYTTKPMGQGVGLGLSISRGIAEAHGGSLELDGRAPHTSFVLTLPLAETPAASSLS